MQAAILGSVSAGAPEQQVPGQSPDHQDSASQVERAYQDTAQMDVDHQRQLDYLEVMAQLTTSDDELHSL